MYSARYAKLRTKHAKANIKNRAKVKLKTIDWWVRVERSFARRKRWKIDRFSMTFPHDIRSQIVKDNEIRIEAIAAQYGYEIVDEKLTTSQSIYWFAKITDETTSD